MDRHTHTAGAFFARRGAGAGGAWGAVLVTAAGVGAGLGADAGFGAGAAAGLGAGAAAGLGVGAAAGSAREPRPSLAGSA
ncbi:hypothetical protein GS929_00655 [Rhodococcus hoagii]|nr:hypothetical protein [Prescottella equi]